MKTDKRQTGRTTRMMKEAIRLAREGRAVYVMFPTIEMGRAVQKTMMPDLLADGPPVRIKFETPGTLESSFCWERMELRRAHKNCVCLVDHHTIERRFGRLLEVWTKFDYDNDQTVGPFEFGTNAITDTDRMDWLEREGHSFVRDDMRPGVVRSSDGEDFYGDTKREAVDAAIKEENADC